MKNSIFLSICYLIFIFGPAEATNYKFREIYTSSNTDTISDNRTRFFRPDDGKSLKDNYIIVYNDLYDMHGTAQTLFSINRLFGRGLDQIICRYDIYKQEYKCLDSDSYLGRLFIDGILNLLFVNWISTIQHECNGHGFRIREEGVPVNKYYCSAGMLSDKGRVDFNFDDLSLYGKILYAVGGSESNTIFSREAFRFGLQKRFFSHYYLYSYFLKIDLPMYILGGTKVGSYNWENGYGDVVKYCMTFNEVSDLTMLEIYQESKKGAYISLLDPSLLLSFYNYIRDYLIKGNAFVKSPMINFKQIGILPFVDFHLTPIGFEYNVGSYVKVNKSLFEPYYRWSYGNRQGKCYGFGLVASNLVYYKRISLSADIDFWHQDFNLIYFDSDNTKYIQKVNAAKFSLNVQYLINNTFGVSGQLGYKGEGFIIGNPLKKGFSYKIGLGAYF